MILSNFFEKSKFCFFFQNFEFGKSAFSFTFSTESEFRSKISYTESFRTPKKILKHAIEKIKKTSRSIDLVKLQPKGFDQKPNTLRAR